MVTFSNPNNFLAKQLMTPEQKAQNAARGGTGATNTVSVNRNGKATLPWQANGGGTNQVGVRTVPQNPLVQQGQATVEASNTPSGTPPASGIYNPADLSAGASAQSGAGSTLLTGGSPRDFGFDALYGTALKNSNDLLTQNNDYGQNINNYLQGAVDPRTGLNINSVLDRNATNRISDVENLYNAGGQKMNDFQKAQSNLRNDAYQSGLFGSKEKASGEAQLSANLFRDRAGQIQAANELSRGEEIGQLDKTRAANQAGAELYGNLRGQNLSASGNFLNSANSAATAGSASDLGFRQLGSDVLQQGMGNQAQASKYNTDLLQQDYQNQFANWQAINQATQQMYENAVGKRAREQAKRLLEQQQAQLKAMEQSWYDKQKLIDPFNIMGTKN